MSDAGITTSGGTSRSGIFALLFVVLLILAPIAWVAWSLYAVSVAAAEVESQSALLAGFRERLAELGQGPGAGPAIADPQSIYVPGETNAIAGAALQELIGSAIEAAGGRVLESELGLEDPEDGEPGKLELRISFETEIEGLQRIVFDLETGTPILMVSALDVRSVGATEVAATESPTLRVVMVVVAHRETEV